MNYGKRYLMDTKLEKKIVFGLGWKFLERIGTQGIVFVVSVVLARLLTPHEYGTIALITIFIDIAAVFVNSGLNTALIQKQKVDAIDYSSVFYISMAIAVIMYVCLFGLAPYIADFYKIDELKPVIRILAFILFPGALNSVQIAYVSKNLEFKKIFYASLISVIVSGGLGICLAKQGYGVWALVVQQLSNQVINSIVLFFIIEWKPQMMFSYTKAKTLFSFGYKLLISNLIGTVYNNIYSLLIGKFYSSSDLGFYSKGKQLPNLLVTNLDSSFQSVMLPVLAKKQDNIEDIKTLAKRMLKASVFLVFPAMCGLLALSDVVITLLLGEKWLNCIPYLQAFCVLFMVYPFHTTNLQTLNALGRSDLFFRFELEKKIVGILILLATIRFGIPVMVIGELASNYISVFINTRKSREIFNYSLWEQIKDVFLILCSAILMGIAVWYIKTLIENEIVKLIVGIITGVSIYLCEIYLIERYRLKKKEG